MALSELEQLENLLSIYEYRIAKDIRKELKRIATPFAVQAVVGHSISQDLLDIHRGNIIDILKRHILKISQQVRERRLKKLKISIGKSWDMQIERWAEKTSWDNANKIVNTSEKEALNYIEDAEDEIEAIPNKPKDKTAIIAGLATILTARAIARSKLIGSVIGHVSITYTDKETAKEVNREIGNARDLYKRWLTAQDERVREAHQLAQGQEVHVDDSFIVDGESLDMPGDPNGSPANIINCRCFVEYFEK